MSSNRFLRYGLLIVVIGVLAYGMVYAVRALFTPAIG